MKVCVADYDKRWPSLYETEAKELRNMLSRDLVNVFHIGSTSVPGLAAKPIIDMLLAVRDINAIDNAAGRFEQMGYAGRGELGIPGRRYFAKGGSNRTHQLHIFQYDNTTGLFRHLAFRDYLRTHPRECDEYATLKKQLAALYPNDIDAYCNGKDGFVKEMEARALQWYWQNLE